MKYLLLVVIALQAGALCSLPACSQPETPPSATHVAEPTDVIDQKLMLALSQAKNFHHKAKVYMSDGKLDDAIASVREILSLQFPAGAPEAEDVRDDARALLAKLLVGKGELDEAMRVVGEGIAASTRESFFVANLYTVQGEIHEARATQLEAAGDAASKAKADEEKHAAIASFDKSIEINAKLQKRLMEEK
jgi:tetratricopeptide (TPR) repeat protein